MFCKSRMCALHATLKDLLQHILSKSVLFQEDHDHGKVEIWRPGLQPSHSTTYAEDKLKVPKHPMVYHFKLLPMRSTPLCTF
ncbi:hypothetical protein JVT61DRAFT_6256 [Boletus reticuloceps]|uniref:Uncharacterized protein n=1 Tax=Boletus reticuloceps TaxID=495285 RepID=A0A8I2YKN0_9AGAM|nr:hypothetical protein JVT61DRAFT_6256 [Boletus reticuloceps]